MRKRFAFLGILGVLLVSLFMTSNSKQDVYAEDSIGTVTISGNVSLVGGNLSGNDFTYILKNTDGQELARTQNASDGTITFENVSYTASEIKNEKYLTYIIEQEEGSDSTIKYDTNKAYIAVELGESEVEAISYAKPNAIEKDYLEFEDTAFHATDEELRGNAYYVYDSSTKGITFFRSEENIPNGRKYYDANGVELPSGSSGIAFIRDFKAFNENAEGRPSVLDHYSDAKSVVFKDAIRPKRITFENFSNCTYYDLRKLDTSLMTNMESMFKDNTMLETIDVSTFDFSHVTTTGYMFDNDERLKTIIVGDWDTSNLERASAMFQGTQLDYFDFERFDDTNFKNAFEMFRDTKLKSVDVTSWKPNAYYDDDSQRHINYETVEFLVNTSPEYLNIGRWVGLSAEANMATRLNLKTFTACATFDRLSSGWAYLVGSDATYIGLNTGDYLGYPVEGRHNICDTYIREGVTTMDFINYKKNLIEINKVDENGDPLSGAEMALLENGGLLQTWVTDGSAKVFSDLENGKSYQIVELSAPDGYKEADPINVSVEDGVVTIDGEVKNSVTIQDERNILDVEKRWVDDVAQARPDSVIVQLVSASDESRIYDQIEIKEEDDWQGSFALRKNKDKAGFDIPLKAIEKSSDSALYHVSYSEEDGKTIITNTFVGSLLDYPFAKKWDDDDESKRPESVTVKIFDKNNMDKPVGTVTLTSDNASGDDANVWEGKFENLLVSDKNGKKIDYVIVEDTISGYETSYAYSDDYAIEGEFSDMFEYTCRFNGDGGYYGWLFEVNDNEALGYVRKGDYNDSYLRFPVSGKFEWFVDNDAKCSGRIIYANVDTANVSDYTGHYTQDGLLALENEYTEKMPEDGVMTSYMGSKDRFIFEGADYEEMADGKSSDETFAGANVIINTKVEEEPEESIDNTETGDKIKTAFVTVGVFGGAIVAYVIYNRRYSRK